MHHLDSLLSKCYLNFKVSFQIPSECTIYRPCFHFFLQFQIVANNQNAPYTVLVFKMLSAFPNRFKYRQNAPLTVLVFDFFSAFPNRF